MKYFAALLLFISTFVSAQTPGEKPAASKEVRKYLENFCKIIKKEGLYGDSIDWNVLQAKVVNLSQGMMEVDETRPVMDTIMNALRKAGDKHTFYFTKAQWEKGNTGNILKVDPESKLLDERVGYIKVPGLLSFNSAIGKAFAESVQDQIKQLDQQHQVTSWIIDLRHNTGGDIRPMIAGLGALRPDGTYAYMSSPKTGKDENISYSKGVSGPIKVKDPYKIKNTGGKIAVLIDSMTGSSGELAAISFKSYPNARFFGQPSAGYTTVNTTFVLSDRSLLNLATGYMVDIDHKTYLAGIVPDVLISLQSNSNVDLTLEAAKKWIEEK